MTRIRQAEYLAKLLGKKEIFSQLPKDSAESVRQYCIYLDVPIRCLHTLKDECICNDSESSKSIDVLICRDTQAVLAVVFDVESRQMEQVFSGPLGRIPYYRLLSEELVAEELQEIADAIETALHKDCRAPKQTQVYLLAKPLARAIQQLKDTSINKAMAKHGQRRVLHRKHLLCADDSVSYYGRACGLFHFLHPKQSTYLLMCGINSADRLRNALRWTDGQNSKIGLAQKLSRIQKNLPVESAYSGKTVSCVQALLDTPLEEFFCSHPQERRKVNELLAHAQFLSRDSAVTAFGNKEHIETYGDVIYAVWNLREYTGMGDSRNSAVCCTCEEILRNLSTVLLSPAESKPVSVSTDKRQNLVERLARIQKGSEKYPIMAEPVSGYCYAGGFLSDSGYPVYLYSRTIGEYLRYYGLAGCSFRQALQFIHNLRDSEDDVEVMDYYMLICDLLVDAVIGALV